MDKASTRSHLFTVRLWEEDLGLGQAEWRGFVQHVPSGKSHYFRDWQEMIRFLMETAANHRPNTPPATEN